MTDSRSRHTLWYAAIRPHRPRRPTPRRQVVPAQRAGGRAPGPGEPQGPGDPPPRHRSQDRRPCAVRLPRSPRAARSRIRPAGAHARPGARRRRAGRRHSPPASRTGGTGAGILAGRGTRGSTQSAGAPGLHQRGPGPSRAPGRAGGAGDRRLRSGKYRARRAARRHGRAPARTRVRLSRRRSRHPAAPLLRGGIPAGGGVRAPRRRAPLRVHRGDRGVPRDDRSGVHSGVALRLARLPEAEPDGRGRPDPQGDRPARAPAAGTADGPARLPRHLGEGASEVAARSGGPDPPRVFRSSPREGATIAPPPPHTLPRQPPRLAGRGRDPHHADRRGEAGLTEPELARVVEIARRAAAAANHAFVGTEHLLAASLTDGEGAAARALTAAGVSLDGLAEELLSGLPVAQGTPSGAPPLSRFAERAVQEAGRGGGDLLAVLLRSPKGRIASVLAQRGARTRDLVRAVEPSAPPPGAQLGRAA